MAKRKRGYMGNSNELTLLEGDCRSMKSVVTLDEVREKKFQLGSIEVAALRIIVSNASGKRAFIIMRHTYRVNQDERNRRFRFTSLAAT